MYSKEIIDNEFFVIDSDNLSEIENRLYGFTVKNNEIIENTNNDEYTISENIGVYVNVQKDGSNIIISQDFSVHTV